MLEMPPVGLKLKFLDIAVLPDLLVMMNNPF